jgi:hypothetical protein
MFRWLVCRWVVALLRMMWTHREKEVVQLRMIQRVREHDTEFVHKMHALLHRFSLKRAISSEASYYLLVLEEVRDLVL